VTDDDGGVCVIIIRIVSYRIVLRERTREDVIVVVVVVVTITRNETDRMEWNESKYEWIAEYEKQLWCVGFVCVIFIE